MFEWWRSRARQPGGPWVRPHISFLLLHNKSPQHSSLKTTHICFITVSVGQKSGCSLTGFSAQGLTRPNSRVGLGL